MKIKALLLLIMILIGSPAGAEIKLGYPPKQKGIALGLFAKDPNYSYYNDLVEIKKYGITHIMLVVSWYQHDISSTELKPMQDEKLDAVTTPDSKLIEVIAQANQLGIRTFLFPIIRINHRKTGEWRGVLKPSDLNVWFASYANFILHYAQIAAANKVEMLLVGSELGSMEKERDRWVELISKVRSVYSGKLIYSANWDHYDKVTFWDKLDYIGMTAYYELSKNKNPDYNTLINSWRNLRAHILAWRKKFTQPLIFTEIGYQSVDGTNIYPWNYFLDGKIDLLEQELCYASFARAWGDTPELGGVYFWVWWGEGGSNDKSYTPRGKPAGEVLKKWFRSNIK